MKMKVKMRPNYVGTLREMEIGDTMVLMATVRNHGGFRNAASRLTLLGEGDWKVSLIQNRVKIERLA